jgi:hypothetical protein
MNVQDNDITQTTYTDTETNEDIRPVSENIHTKGAQTWTPQKKKKKRGKKREFYPQKRNILV